jgi:hypothetical protein
MSLILPPPTALSWFQAHWLGQLPVSLGRSYSVRSGITRRDGNRHVRWELRRRPEGSGGIYSNVARVPTHGLRYRLAFRMIYA